MILCALAASHCADAVYITRMVEHEKVNGKL